MPDTQPATPQTVAERACELARDARAAVVLDGSGTLAGSSETDGERAQELGDLVRELVEAMDAAAPGENPEQLEAQVVGGAVYLVRRGGWTIAAVARRRALSSLMFYDLRAVLAPLEDAA